MVIDAILRMPVSVHPAEHELEAFMRGELPPSQAALIVRHLLTGCPECLEVTRPLWALMKRKPKRLGIRLCR